MIWQGFFATRRLLLTAESNCGLTIKVGTRIKPVFNFIHRWITLIQHNLTQFFCLLGVYLELIIILSFGLDYLISKWYGIMIVYNTVFKVDIIHDGYVRVFRPYRLILIIMEVPKMMRKVDSSEGNLEKLVSHCPKNDIIRPWDLRVWEGVEGQGFDVGRLLKAHFWIFTREIEKINFLNFFH